jgi:hypothetical protein
MHLFRVGFLRASSRGLGRLALTALLGCAATAVVGCDRGDAGAERAKFERASVEPARAAFSSLGKRDASEAPQLR